MAKTTIITGASRGIGLAIAEYLLRDGHNVVVVARSKAPLEELQAKYPKQVRTLTGDMADFSLAKKIADLTIKEFGQIDGLVVNHGLLPPVSDVAESDVESWRKHFDVNFFNAVALAKATLPALRKSKGCIILTSSGAAVNAMRTWGAYCCSKAALHHLGMNIAVEEPDITTISIAPGVVDTEMQRELRDTHSSAMRSEDAARFHTLHKDGGLLKPEQPGNVMARIVLNPPKEMSGNFVRWDNKEELGAYQEK
ncbi:MAG: hypothetical protein MMC33_001949 [Icmadophila ericetorum]|nr:hypothetical protein [Icmadophila ericetorum]